MKKICNIFVAFLAFLGLISAATLQTPTVIRQLDDKGLAVAPKLRFEGAGGDESALQFVKKGQNLDLHCEAFGQPVPVVYWTRNGEPLAATGTGAAAEAPEANLLEKVRNLGIRTYQIGNTVAIHRIPCATAEDSGIFTCVADNGHQMLKRNVELVVEEGDSTCSPNPGIPAFITMWSDLRMDREFADVQVFCRAAGEPKPKIKWFNEDGVEIKDGTEYEILKNGDLMVKKIEFFRNGGGLNCSARNEFGEDSKEIFVYGTKYDGEDEKKGL